MCKEFSETEHLLLLQQWCAPHYNHALHFSLLRESWICQTSGYIHSPSNTHEILHCYSVMNKVKLNTFTEFGNINNYITKTTLC